jgi:hypothetical protein
MLAGPRFVQIFRGVYRVAGDEPDLAYLLSAARLVLPDDASASHLTALRLFGLNVRSRLPLHFSSNTGAYVERPGICLHRRQGRLNPVDVQGQRVLGHMRTFVDVATLVSDRELLRVGDWMAAEKLVELDALRA